MGNSSKFTLTPRQSSKHVVKDKNDDKCPTMSTSKEPSQLYKTAMQAIEGYNNWDIDAIFAPRTETCTQRVYPERLDRPVMNNTEYRAYFSAVLPIFKDFHIEITDVVEDPTRHKVALHARSTATTAIGDYANEYMILIQMTEDDARVENVKEFVDSGFSVDYFQRLRAHHATTT